MAYLVNEVFSSLQGEGPAIGAPATFIRLSGCNLACAYCDTAHVRGRSMEITEILDRAAAGPERVVITGGEPVLAGEALAELAGALVEAGKIVDIETNGTIIPPAGLEPLIDNYVISPKLANSGMPPAERRLADGLPPGSFKFAAEIVDDLDEAAEVAALHPGREVIVMPLGTDPAAILKRMAALRRPVAERGWRLLPRLQVLLGIR